MSVTVYTKNNCPQCASTLRRLDRLRVEYRTVALDESPEALDYVQSLGFQAAPVVTLDNGDAWSGFRPDRITALVSVAV